MKETTYERYIILFASDLKTTNLDILNKNISLEKYSPILLENKNFHTRIEEILTK